MLEVRIEQERHYFMSCFRGNHDKCSVKRIEEYRGKPETVYCECPCHISHGRIQLIPERRHPRYPGEIDPIDEPYLPQDPGDEP